MSKPTSKSKPGSSRAAACWTPTPPQLERAPELAILAAIDCALQTATSALLAVYPEFCDMEPHFHEPFSPAALGASQIMSTADQLRTNIAGYRSAIEREQREKAQQVETGDIPF